MADKLKLGIPKGSLQDATIALFEKRRVAHLMPTAARTFPASTIARLSAC